MEVVRAEALKETRASPLARDAPRDSMSDVAGLASIAASYFYGRRAPDCWKFYKMPGPEWYLFCWR